MKYNENSVKFSGKSYILVPVYHYIDFVLKLPCILFKNSFFFYIASSIFVYKTLRTCPRLSHFVIIYHAYLAVHSSSLCTFAIKIVVAQIRVKIAVFAHKLATASVVNAPPIGLVLPVMKEVSSLH